MPHATNARPSRNGKYVAIAMVVLWILVLVAVYVVIVPLKLGGKEGTMREQPAAVVSPAIGE